jgi:hypothetical protein
VTTRAKERRLTLADLRRQLQADDVPIEFDPWIYSSCRLAWPPE